MGIARIDPAGAPRGDGHEGHMPDGDGFLVVALIAASWAATLAVGWVIWRLVTL